MDNMQKERPVSNSDFKDLIQQSLPFVDKTLMIRDILHERNDASLFLRPSGYGKSLSLSMLRYFFSNEEGNNPEQLFAGLKIMECGPEVLSEMGQYPVILVSLEALDAATSYDEAITVLRDIAAKVYQEHLSIREKLDDFLAWRFDAYLAGSSSVDIDRSLQFLAECLWWVYRKKAVILLDAYDNPLYRAHTCSYLDPLSFKIRNLLTSTFGANSYLELGVITGCLPLSLVSIFDYVNFELYDVTKEPFSEYFGFTEDEVVRLFQSSGKEVHLPQVKERYDGYRMGGRKIFTTRDIMAYLHKLLTGQDSPPDDSFIRDICEKVRDTQIRESIALLAEGKSIETELDMNPTYDSLYSSPKALYTTLLAAGYLTVASGPTKKRVYTLRVPNREVLESYERTIESYMDIEVYTPDDTFIQAFLGGDAKGLQAEITQRLQNIISVWDENSQSFMVTLLTNLPDERFSVKVGEGSPDIVVQDKRNKNVYIVECKNARTYQENMYVASKAALRHERAYARAFVQRGFSVTLYGLGFFMKAVKVLVESAT